MCSGEGNRGERSIEYPALEELVADQKGCEVAELSIKWITGIAGLWYLIKDKNWLPITHQFFVVHTIQIALIVQ